MRPSILDRLLPSGWGRDRLEDQLQADLEALLNTRCHLADEWEADFPAAAGSIAAHGLSDADDCLLTSAGEINGLRDRVEKTIRRFEPRLRDPKVRVIEAPRKFTQEVVLEIRATLRLTGDETVWSSTLRGGRVSIERER